MVTESKTPIRNIETEEIVDIERYEKAKKRRKKDDTSNNFRKF